ncbi:hypothetical protein C8R44DRAFT_726677 [Mycena epipterygia]|nr:hypothetical protein C8R44DRAFT_726677 [Mycena epipterygia]
MSRSKYECPCVNARRRDSISGVVVSVQAAECPSSCSGGRVQKREIWPNVWGSGQLGVGTCSQKDADSISRTQQSHELGAPQVHVYSSPVKASHKCELPAGLYRLIRGKTHGYAYPRIWVPVPTGLSRIRVWILVKKTHRSVFQHSHIARMSHLDSHKPYGSP